MVLVSGHCVGLWLLVCSDVDRERGDIEDQAPCGEGIDRCGSWVDARCVQARL